jgi:hypothetical protein
MNRSGRIADSLWFEHCERVLDRECWDMTLGLTFPLTLLGRADEVIE